MNRRQNHFLFIVLLLVTAGCATSAPKEIHTPTAAASTPAAAASTLASIASTPATPASTPTTPQVDEAPPGEPFITAPNIASIALVTDTQGVGEKPLLQWESVTDADAYQLVVFDEEGRPYWAWEGGAMQIYLGGTDVQPPENSSGPVIADGYSWAVVAYNSEGQLIASSAVRTISP